MRRVLFAVAIVVVLGGVLFVSSLRLDPGVDLAELARSSGRIVLGRVERVEHLERPPVDPKRDETLMTRAEKRWKGVSSIALAELKIEQTFKGRTDVKSVWFHAQVRSGEAVHEVAQGERLLLFLGERIHFIPFGREFGERVRSLTGDYGLEEAVVDGSIAIEGKDAPMARCASGVVLPKELAKVARYAERTADVPWNDFEPELRKILDRQLPIIHAVDTLDRWELFVYGDRRCALTTWGIDHDERRSFDLAAERYDSLWKLFEAERFRNLPEEVNGGGFPDDSDFQRIDVTTSERTQTVRIWDARNRLRPTSSDAMASAVRLMIALRDLPQKPTVREKR